MRHRVNRRLNRQVAIQARRRAFLTHTVYENSTTRSDATHSSSLLLFNILQGAPGHSIERLCIGLGNERQ